MDPKTNIQHVLPYRFKSTPTVRQCVCDIVSCKTLSFKFRELGGKRGMYTDVPTIENNSFKNQLATV